MSASPHVLIAGCGYVGSALAARLQAAGRSVFTLRRSEHKVAGCVALRADLGEVAELSGALCALPAGEALDVCYLAAAGGYQPALYRRAYVAGPRNLLNALATRPLRRVVYASSTAVYGDAEGGWVDETTPARPSAFSGEVLLAGERWIAAARGRHCILRFGGIYGPGRNRLIERILAGEAIAPAAGPHYQNRIHRDDCAAIVQHVLEIPSPRRLYNAVDDAPVALAEVQQWLCEQLGVDVAGLRPGGGRRQRRPASNKRCLNRRLTNSGYQLLFADYRSGYASLLAASLGRTS